MPRVSFNKTQTSLKYQPSKSPISVRPSHHNQPHPRKSILKRPVLPNYNTKPSPSDSKRYFTLTFRFYGDIEVTPDAAIDDPDVAAEIIEENLDAHFLDLIPELDSLRIMPEILVRYKTNQWSNYFVIWVTLCLIRSVNREDAVMICKNIKEWYETYIAHMEIIDEGFALKWIPSDGTLRMKTKMTQCKS